MERVNPNGLSRTTPAECHGLLALFKQHDDDQATRAAFADQLRHEARERNAGRSRPIPSSSWVSAWLVRLDRHLDWLDEKIAERESFARGRRQ